MAIAETESAKRLQRLVGKRLRILVDRVDEQGGIGRTAGDAPEIDGLVRILPANKPSKRYRVGEFIKARIVSAQGHDLLAEV
jgi:ribosomal protein S12 methylthiotransferase